MYILPTDKTPNIVNIGAVDNNGKPKGGWITIPVCKRNGAAHHDSPC